MLAVSSLGVLFALREVQRMPALALGEKHCRTGEVSIGICCEYEYVSFHKDVIKEP